MLKIKNQKENLDADLHEIYTDKKIEPRSTQPALSRVEGRPQRNSTIFSLRFYRRFFYYQPRINTKRHEFILDRITGFQFCLSLPSLWQGYVFNFRFHEFIVLFSLFRFYVDI